jgi:site-specific DNA recombinase
MSDVILFNQFAKSKKEFQVKTNNCVIYTRVSTKEQADNNMSLETQRKACEQLAQRNKYIIAGYFGGTYESAKTDERKEFNRMLQFVKKSSIKISYIIVYSVDRFSRSGGNAIYITEQLKKQGVIVLSVTQPTDATTPSGSLQQNIQFIFSEYDNQLRKEKCMAGVKDALIRGEWCHRAPFGYDIVKRDGKRRLVVNEKGKLLKKAFLWKANENLSTEECRLKLQSLGLNIYHQKLTNIFRSPFYCGLIAHTALDGKVIEGTQERLITKEMFLKINSQLDENRHGYSLKRDNDDVPLKNFIKCGHCGSSMPGYLVKKKNLWYYKCRKKGCCNNKSAKELHKIFFNVLSRFKADEKSLEVMKEQMIRTFNQMNKDNSLLQEQLTSQLQDLQKKAERLEERYILEEITQEMFLKFQAKFRQETAEIQRRLQQVNFQVSNPEECVEAIIRFAANLPKLWEDSDYREKVRLQNLLFPSGIHYDKKKDECRTSEIKPTFLWLVCNSKGYSKNKSGIPELNLTHTTLVGPPGLEPGTHRL